MAGDQTSSANTSGDQIVSVPEIVSTVRGRPSARPKANLPPARLGIGHYFLVIAGAALYFSISTRGDTASLGAGDAIVLSLYGLIVGLSWCCCLIVGKRCVLGRRWEIEPGLWLGVILGCQLAIGLMVPWLARHVFSHPSRFASMLVAALYVAPLLTGKLSPRWRNLFIVFVILLSLPFLLESMRIWAPFKPFTVNQLRRFALMLTNPVLLLSVLFVIGLDSWSKQRFSWRHWVGLSTWAVLIIMRPLVNWLT